MDKEIRVPQQKRSREKKEKIIETANALFSKNGYLTTTTSDIAKEAGLSVGTLYSYYKDKKAILQEALNNYSDNLTNMFITEINKISSEEKLIDVIKNMIKLLIEAHNFPQKYHDEIMALQFIDNDIKEFHYILERKMATALIEKFRKMNVEFKYPEEQVYLLFSLLYNLDDQLVYNIRPDLNNEILIDQYANIFLGMLDDRQ